MHFSVTGEDFSAKSIIFRERKEYVSNLWGRSALVVFKEQAGTQLCWGKVTEGQSIRG